MNPALTFLFVFFAAQATGPSATVAPVVLSDQHRALCRVEVGQPFPKFEGLKVGPRATVVAALAGEGWMNRQLADDLPRDVVQAFGKLGVAAVLLDGRDNPRGPLPEAPGCQTLTCGNTGLDLLGAPAKAPEKSRWPRLYLLDPAGRVVWFDIEYSLSSRRELQSAIEATLGGEQRAAKP